MRERAEARRWIFGLGLVLVVALVLVLVRSLGRQPRAPGGPPAATVAVEGEAPALGPSLPDVTHGAPEERREAPEREELEERAPEGTEPTGLRIEVVTADGRPAAGATVAMLDTLREFETAADPDDEFALGRHVSADARGEAWLPRPRGTARVAAWQPGSFAELALFPEEPGPVRLVLARDEPIAVRVVGRDGSPREGLPVVLRTEKEIVTRRRTGADGLVELSPHGRRAALEQAGAIVQLGVPLREAVFARVEPQRAGPIELVAPELGAVEVRLFEGRAEFLDEVPVLIGISERMRETLDAEARLGSLVVRTASGGRATLEHVGLGLELLALVRSPFHAETGSEFAGPARAAETVAVELTLGPEAVRLAGRLRSAEGPYLGEVLAEFLLLMPKGPGQIRRLLTDPEGAFTLPFPGIGVASSAEGLRVRVLAPAGSAHQGQFPLRLREGANELGELVLERLPLLVAGRVRDEQGVPVAGLVLEVLQRFDPADPASGSPLSAKVVSDALGRFALHQAAPRDGGLALRVRQRGYRFGAEAVVPGTDDLEVVVRATGTLAGQLLFDGGWAPTLLLFQDGVPVRPQSMVWSGDARFRHDYLLSGEYDLEWSHPWASERGFVRGLRVVAGQEVSDPRLAPLDLRGAWPRVRVRVEDEAGAPVAGAHLELWRDGGFAPYVLKPGPSELDVVAGPLPLRARVSAAGFRARELELAADATVVLARGPILRLLVPATLPQLPRDWSWATWVSPEEDEGPWREPLPIDVGETPVALESAGFYRLQFGALRRLETRTDEAGRTLEYRVEVDELGKTLTLAPFEAEFVESVLAEIAAEDPFTAR